MGYETEIQSHTRVFTASTNTVTFKVLETRINWFIIRIIIHEQNIFLEVQIILFQMRNMLRNKP